MSIKAKISLFLVFLFAFFPQSLLVNALAGPCEEYQSIPMTERCYGEEAVQKDDLGECAKTPWGTSALCYGVFAASKKDPSICEKLEHSARKDFCYDEVASRMKDETVCEKIVSQDHKYICYIQVDPIKNKAMCSAIGNINMRDGCALSVALAEEDPAYCESAEFQETKDKCYFEIVRMKKMFQLCEKISTDYLKKACYKLTNYPDVSDKGGSNAASGN